MFHDPDSQALNAQLARQRVVIDYIAGALNIPPDRVRHVFLLPKELKARASTPMSSSTGSPSSRPTRWSGRPIGCGS